MISSDAGNVLLFIIVGFMMFALLEGVVLFLSYFLLKYAEGFIDLSGSLLIVEDGLTEQVALGLAAVGIAVALLVQLAVECLQTLTVL